MGTADALLAWAAGELGTTENPPGSNHVRYWDDIDQHGNQGQPWCGAFYLAGLLRIGVVPVTRSVYVPQIRADYQRAGRLRPIEEAQPGDQVLFSFGNHSDKTHTGIVESVDPKAHTVTSIDGNTSPAMGGVEWNGGGVYRRIRPWAQTWGVGHPAFDPKTGVKPMYDPPLPPTCASRSCPTGGVWLLSPQGAIGAIEGAPFAGGPFGKPYFVGHTAARFATDEEMTAAEKAAGKLYVVLDTAGNHYAYPE